MSRTRTILRATPTPRKLWRELRNNPARTVSILLMACIFGQGVYWGIGSDQFGVFMNPKVRVGIGYQVGSRVYEHIPHTARAAWWVKIAEIITDLGRAPAEAVLQARVGFAPDIVATVVTQPLWSVIEAGEKTAGAVVHPERVDTPDQVRQSIANIYGSLFRYLLVIIYLLLRRPLRRRVQDPLTRLLIRLGIRGQVEDD